MNMLSVCNNAFLGVLLKIVKDGLKLIQIIGPLLLMVSLGFTFVKLMQKPDDKKLFARIKNSLLALAVLFFIPTIVIAVLNMVDESSEFGACWKNGASGNLGNPSYIDVDGDNDRTNIIGESNYEKGEPGSTDNGNSSSSSNNSVNDSVTSTGSGVIGMHINSKNKIVYNLYNQSSSEWKGHYYSSGQDIKKKWLFKYICCCNFFSI